ncbi:MAG TPA: ATP-binding cassette domain-containing protein, partial [Desulfatiglandales bacterium]
MAGEPLLQVTKLSKSFGGVQAIMNVSFDLAKGEILGVIGPNGSGKNHPGQPDHRFCQTGHRND